MRSNRRDAVGSGLKLLGAAVGINATAGRVWPDTLRSGSPSEMVLHGRNWCISSLDFSRGELPTAGIRMLARGEIVDKPARGKKLGEFFATYYRLAAPGKVPADHPGSLEVHTFVFPDGTLIGTGVAPAGHDLQAEFAITGGTGRYHGARGSYVAKQSYLEFGGNGTATFKFKLI